MSNQGTGGKGEKNTPASSSMAAGRGGPLGVKGVSVLAHYSSQAWAWCLDMDMQNSTAQSSFLLAGWGGQQIPTCNGSRFSCMALRLYHAATGGRVGCEGGLRRRRAAVTSHPGAILTYQITSPIEAGWLDC